MCSNRIGVGEFSSMKSSFVHVVPCLALLSLLGCASTLAVPSVAILISIPGGAAPTQSEVASIYKIVRPEIERLGYVVAKNTLTADFAVYVSDLVDPLGASGGRLKLERLDTRSTREKLAAESDEFKRASQRANSDMVREPK
jgi:hypothetical protein